MENFLFQIKALALAFKLNLSAIIHHPFIWGLVLGFAMASIIHGFIITKDPRYIPHILTNEAAMMFNKIAPRRKDGMYLQSFTDFINIYNQIRLIFYISIFLFLLIVLVILLRA